ncbi:U-actitoxin-Avd3l-like [Leptopilina heterotoma]|uniref:U-actitoxin-Avd3l-like n=1 Tax=Leptopilina heterotoma TaxID=63436 RepID=UPI001CA9DF3A|nr:U-actitoxin-Avd3l-like [Leptopilina heterotoma]
MHYKFFTFFFVLCVIFMMEFDQSNGQGNEICRLPLLTGRCRANFERYGYVPSARSCQQFTYGGCDGNANNFESKSACEEFCTVCRLPMKRGTCDALIPRYWYVFSQRRCELFMYGGCGGNANNFVTREECERQCSNSK